MSILDTGLKEKKRQSGSRLEDGYGDFIDTSAEDTPIAGYPLSWWINNYGLPLHINYEPLIRRNIRAFKQVLAQHYPEGRIRYAAKAYCHPAVFKVIREEGIGVDVSSYNETRAAIESGISPSEINLNGNAKEDFLIRQAVELGILITVDSVEELRLVSHMAQELGRQAQVLVRVSGFDIVTATDECIFTSGVWTKFGISPDKAKKIAMNPEQYPDVEIYGFHMHIGSQIAGKENFMQPLSVLIELGHILKNSGHECRILNIGGGFPLAYMSEEEWDTFQECVKKGMMQAEKGDFSKLYVWNNEQSGYVANRNGDVDFGKWEGEMFYSSYPKEKMVEAILGGIVTINGKEMNTVKALEGLGRPQLLIEPGRSIIGDTGVTLARVSHVKEIAYGHNLLVLEMGVVNYAGSVIHKLVNSWAVLNDYNRMEDKPFEAFACGNLCYNGDIIAKYKIQLQRTPQRGDVVLIYDTGGTESHFFASNANSYPRPSRVLVDDKGIITATKSRETYEAVFNL